MIAPKSHEPDYLLMLTVIGLIVFGLVMVSSAGVVISHDSFGDVNYFFIHQLYNGAIPGFIALLFFQSFYYRRWRKFSFWFLIIALVLLILVFVPGISLKYGGAARWIVLGPISLQPTELGKLAFILYLAAWLENRQEHLRDINAGLLPFVLITGIVSFLVILQPDIGTLAVIGVTSILIYFMAGASLSHFVIVVGMAVAAGMLLIKSAPYRLARFTVFLHPEVDPKGIGYQINQALLAIGTGGLFGLGLGHSRQKFNYLPEPVGDSIFSIIAEEMGFVRVLVLLGLFLIIAWRGYKIANEAPDGFSRLAAFGITTWIIVQALMHIAANISLMPLTGIPLPFISYGGSALVFLSIGVGILVNISRYTKTAGESRNRK